MAVSEINPLSTYPFLEYDKELSHFLYNQGIQNIEDVTIENYAAIFKITPVYAPYSFTYRDNEGSYVSINCRLNPENQKQEFFLGIAQIEVLRKQGVYNGRTLPVAVKEQYNLRLIALYLALPYHLKHEYERISYSEFLVLCKDNYFSPDFLCERLENTYQAVLFTS